MIRSKFLKGLFLATGTLFAQELLAQNAPTGYYIDAARFSQNYIGGSARFQGLAGAGSALGGDLTSPALNPAGLGVYRKSDLGITTNLGFLNSSGEFLNETTKDNRAYLNFPNFGVAFCNVKDDIEEGFFRGGTFSITYNKINNFQSQVMYSGSNRNSSILTSFTELVNRRGVPNDDSEQISSLESLIYLSFLTERDENNIYYNPIDSVYNYETRDYENQFIRSSPNYQEQTITTKGGQNQFDFAYGGNLGDKYYIGGGVGIIRHRYFVTKDFYEQPNNQSGIEDLTFNQSFRTTGTGINGKLGVIVKASDALRFSLNLQTPTVYALTENYQYSVLANFNPDYYVSIIEGTGADAVQSDVYPGQQDNRTVSNEFKYSVTTPAIIRGGAAYIIGKVGFITGDVEYVPYSTVRLRNSQSASLFNGDNRIIKNQFSNVVNFKLGGELRQGMLRLRGGYAFTGDPLKDFDDINRTIHTISLGAGIKLPSFYMDFAVVNSRTNSFDSPYTLMSGTQPGARIKNGDTGIMVSIGTSF